MGEAASGQEACTSFIPEGTIVRPKSYGLPIQPARRADDDSKAVSIVAIIEDREECLLRDLDIPYLFHTLLALFLLFEKFAFARNIAAVALGGDILAEGRDAFPGDHAAANRRLDRDFKLMTLDLTFELL